MKGQELIIKFKDDLAFITDEVALDLKQVDISERPVRFQQEAFWTVRVINHIEHENRLFVEVLSYQVGDLTMAILKWDFKSGSRRLSS